VLSGVSATRAASWSVLTPVTATRATSWVVAGSVYGLPLRARLGSRIVSAYVLGRKLSAGLRRINPTEGSP
jgi:hypothetical protein